MNQEILMWLIGGCYALSLLMFGAGLSAYINMVQRQTKVETFLLTFGEKAARILHSPHTPEFDKLLEKFYNKNYVLTDNEWKKLLEMCEAIENDEKEPKGIRGLAAWIAAICHAQLKHDPTKVKRQYKTDITSICILS